MVTETVPEVDQVPAEVQTEIPAEVEEETPATEVGDAAETGEEAATEVNDEPPSIEPPPKTYTEAEVREQARLLAQQEREAERARIQAENGRRAWQQQQEAAQRAERQEVVELALSRGDDPEAVVKLLDRWDAKRANQWLDHSETLATQALGALAEQIEGRQPVISDPRVQKVYDTLEPAMNLAFQAGMQAAMEHAIPETELDKYVNAEIARRNQKAREGQKPIPRTEGTASSSVEQGSHAWWSALGPEGRKDPANQRIFDSWIAKNS